MSILNIKTVPTRSLVYTILLTFAISLGGTSALSAGEQAISASTASRIDDNSGDGKGGKGDAKNATVLRVGDNRKNVEMRILVQLPIARLANMIHTSDAVHLRFTVKDTYGAAEAIQLHNLVNETGLGIEFSNYHEESPVPMQIIEIDRQKGSFDADITSWAKAAVLNAQSMLTLRFQVDLDEADLRDNGSSDHFWIEAEGEKAIRMVIASTGD